MRAPTESAYILLEDGSEAGTIPASARETLLTRLARILLFGAVLMVYGLSARPAYAERSEAAAATFVAPHYCNDRDELAGVLMVEGGAQRIEDIIRMAQILSAEAESRGLTICALTRVTNFTTVRHYARAHPESWAAHNLDNPPEWMLDLVSEVLRGAYPDIRAGAMHFDGDGMRVIFKP